MRRFFGVLVLVVALSGCATMFNNKEPLVAFSSAPDDAEVYVNGIYLGNTPLEAPLSIRKEHTVTIKKEGHQERSQQITRSAGFGWIILDILGGLFPIIVDAATGDWFMLDSDHVHMTLQEEG